MRSPLRAASPGSARADLLEQLFPRGVPNLWCPSLTHYTLDGAIDGSRIAAHLRHLSQSVKGFLIPGSTSDGWELAEKEFWTLLEIALEQARRLELHLLIGILKADAAEALVQAEKVLAHLKRKSNQTDLLAAMAEARVCGLVVCAPRGHGVSQEEIERGLVPVLETGAPVALYQLPQMTLNEIGPELALKFAQRFPNFLLFKDSSGTDRVVLSGNDLGGVFMMRGAEGNYLRWLKAAGGSYDGFLLSAANGLASELSQMIGHARAGDLDEAQQLSEKVTAIINEVFEIVRPVAGGNIYANANKAIDHFVAHGRRATELSGPRLHAGSSLPAEVLRKTGEVLAKYGVRPDHGYVDR